MSMVCASVFRRLIRSTARCGTVQNQPSGRRRSSPRSVSRADQGPGAGSEPALVARPQRQLLRGRRQLRTQHRWTRRIEHRRLHRLVEEHGRVIQQVRVQGVGPGDQDHVGRSATPSGATGLLPEGGSAARVAAQHHGVEPGEVDPELQGVGRRHPADGAVRQPAFDQSAVVREVASPVRQHAARLCPRRARADRGLGRPRHLLGQPPGRHEGEHLLAGSDPGGHQLRGGGLRCEVRTGEADPYRTADRAVVIDQPQVVDGDPGQRRRRLDRPGGGGAQQREGRVGAVVRGDPPEPPQHRGHLGTENAAIAVRLVDHHVPQRAQERGPPGVVRQREACSRSGLVST